MFKNRIYAIVMEVIGFIRVPIISGLGILVMQIVCKLGSKVAEKKYVLN